jgi:hypothetical protein
MKIFDVFYLYLVEIGLNVVIFRISHIFLLCVAPSCPSFCWYLLSSLPAVAGVPAVAGALLLLLASSFMKALFAEVL